MRKLIIILILLFVATPAFAWMGTVVKVSDGDTIWVKDATSDNIIKVRLYGIDAPEKNQPYGAEATLLLTALALDKDVVVTDLAIDMYGRNVSVVALVENGNSLQEYMLFNGAAWLYKGYSKGCSFWGELQKEAKADKCGLWADDDCIEPWKWRKNGGK